ncbi:MULTISPECIES: hypothetical protein [unclassified Streptomyces]|uniref:hypothetical protein n=1 Tax=unclassified Streptomyces TaxID=2593676 RepID=UPI001F15A0FF|nr:MULTISPECIES: hypothetical protein [unclassified Streptomyces]
MFSPLTEFFRGAASTGHAMLIRIDWYGKTLALGIVTGVLLLWFAAALTWAYVDRDHGRHAVRRAYNLTFGWGDWF